MVHPKVLVPRKALLFLLTGLTAGVVASCTSTTSDPDAFDFEVKRPETNEEKMERVFGSYDPEQRSPEEGKQFDFGQTGNPEFSKSIARKEYPVHPYFQVRDQDVLRDRGPIPLQSAREGNRTARQEGQQNSWFGRTFRTGEAEQFKKAFPKEQNTEMTGSERPSANAHDYGDRVFWTEIIENIKEGDTLSVEDVQALFSPY